MSKDDVFYSIRCRANLGNALIFSSFGGIVTAYWCDVLVSSLYRQITFSAYSICLSILPPWSQGTCIEGASKNPGEVTDFSPLGWLNWIMYCSIHKVKWCPVLVGIHIQSFRLKFVLSLEAPGQQHANQPHKSDVCITHTHTHTHTHRRFTIKCRGFNNIVKNHLQTAGNGRPWNDDWGC